MLIISKFIEKIIPHKRLLRYYHNPPRKVCDSYDLIWF